MTDSEQDQHDSYFLAIAALRKQLEAKRKLTPREMIVALDTDTPLDPE